MPQEEARNYKYVFVCGLHRSGTSLLGRNVGRLQDCTPFKNTPFYIGTSIPIDEGEHLQDIYPLDLELGGPGRFGFDSRSHRTENSELLTPDNVARLRARWHRYWDKSKTICVEKTPGNILMTRFLQTAFPNSYFIVIRRHPIAVSMSTQRMWSVKITSLHRLFRHWLHCYELFEQDKRHLKHVYELTYEDYIGDPAKYHQEIAAFIGTRVPESGMEDVKRANNKKYIDRWYTLLNQSGTQSYCRYIVRKYEQRIVKYGYSLTTGLDLSGKELCARGKTSAAVGALYCLKADIAAFLRRFHTLTPKLLIQAILPDFILGRIRRARRSAALRKGEGALKDMTAQI
jgi:Sulfotransferase family